MTRAHFVPPMLTIAAGDEPLAPTLGQSAALVLVRAVLGMPAVAEIDFEEPDRDAVAALAVGRSLRLAVAGDALFSGTVAAVHCEHRSNGTSRWRVRAYDPLEALRQRGRVRRFEGISAASFAAELAAELGIPSRTEQPSADVGVVLQEGRSDLETLAELAVRDGLYPVIDDGALALVTLAGTGDEIELRLGDDLYEATLGVSAERSAQAVDVEAWSLSTYAALRAGVVRSAEPGARATVIADRAVESVEQSRALGEAALARAAAYERTASGSCRGDPALRPGRAVRIVGAAPTHGGRYVLTSTLHRFDQSGYRVEFDTRPPNVPAPARAPLVTVGRVASTDDPERRGRCLVSLPGFGATEAGWLPVVVAGAGRRKGAAVLPEVGDDVLAIFAGGDLGHGFVLGGLYGERTLPPGLRDDEDRPFVIRTGGGQSLELSGKGAVARLATHSGSVLELKHDGARLAAASDLVIEAPGKRLVFRAASIDFEQG